MKLSSYKNVFILLIILVSQLFFYRGLRAFPQFVERWYATGIYPFIGKTMRFLLGWIPFSIGDILYVVLIFIILRYLIKYGRSLITLSRKRITQSLLFLNVLLFSFHFLWGFNYYRQPLAEKLQADKSTDTEALYNVTQRFIDLANASHAQLQSVDSLPVHYQFKQADFFEIAAVGYEQSPLEFIPKMGNTSIKKSLLSWPLTYMGYSGYLNPITGEAHTNFNIEYYKTPVLILHEMAHQVGYAKENEANFIAIATGIHHPNIEFKYSAQLFALRYLLQEVAQTNREEFNIMKAKLRPGILANYNELRHFWSLYEGVIEDVSQATYNEYLKANNQPDGLRSYSLVAGLLIQYHDALLVKIPLLIK